MDSDKYI